VRSEVQCLPIPTLALPPGIPDRGWTKLTTFKADLHGLRGTALFLDLDMVIVGDITTSSRLPGEFLIIHDWKRPWRVTGNSSVYRFRIGAHPDLLQRFRRAGTACASATATSRPTCRTHCTQGRLAYWPKGLVLQLQVPLHPALALNYWRAPSIPAGTRIVIFHGEINPPDAIRGGRSARGRFLLPAPWVTEHWTA
jgi:hypothetical protein